MKHIKIILITSIISLISISTSYAQTNKVNGIEPIIGSFQGISPLGDSLFKYKAHIYMNDTLDILKVNFKIGNGYLTSDIYDSTYNFYPAEGVSNPQSVTRDGLQFTIDLGDIPPRPFFWKICTEDFNGNITDTYVKQK